MSTTETIAIVISCISLGVATITLILNSEEGRWNKFSAKMEFVNKIHEWYKELIILMKEIEYKENQMLTYSSELMKFSALIEYGRFFFPNCEGDKHGEEKPLPYQGYRNIVLDFLVAYYNLFSFNNRQKYSSDAANRIQRHFTSEVFKSLKPNTYLEQAERYTVGEFKKNDFVGKCLPDENDKFILKLIFGEE